MNYLRRKTREADLKADIRRKKRAAIQVLKYSYRQENRALLGVGQVKTSEASLNLDADSFKHLESSESSFVELEPQISSFNEKSKSVEKLAEPGQKSVKLGFNLPASRDSQGTRPVFRIHRESQLEIASTSKSPPTSPEMMKSKLFFLSIESKDAIKASQQPSSSYMVAKKGQTPRSKKGKPDGTPKEKVVKLSSFSINSGHVTPSSPQQSLYVTPVKNLSPTKIKIDRSIYLKPEEENAKNSDRMPTQANVCFSKKYSESILKSRSKSKDFKINFSRCISEANLQNTNASKDSGSEPVDLQKEKKLISTPAKIILKGSLARLESLHKNPGDVFNRGFERVSFTKKIGPSSEARHKDRLTCFAPFMSPKSWAEKDEFVQQHQKTIKRNQADRRLRILQSTINMLDREQQDTTPAYLFKQTTRRKP